jgi:hypothetical protein
MSGQAGKSTASSYNDVFCSITAHPANVAARNMRRLVTSQRKKLDRDFFLLLVACFSPLKKHIILQA